MATKNSFCKICSHAVPAKGRIYYQNMKNVLVCVSCLCIKRELKVYCEDRKLKSKKERKMDGWRRMKTLNFNATLPYSMSQFLLKFCR